MKIEESILISTIIPMYNCEQYVEKCIDSVLNQQIKNIEIICIDDGSTDNTVNIVKKMMLNDNRIKLSVHKHQNAGFCRNKGIELSTGKYLHFLDADDWLEPYAYSKLQNYITEYERTDMFIFTRFRYDMRNEETVRIPLYHNSGYVTNFILEPNLFLESMVAAWNKIFDSRFIKENEIKFDEIPCCNDRGFYFESAIKSKKIVFINEPLMTYRWKNKDSIVGSIRNIDFTSPQIPYNRIQKILSEYSNTIKNKLYEITVKDMILHYDVNKSVNHNILKDFIVQEESKGYKIKHNDETWYDDYLIIKKSI